MLWGRGMVTPGRWYIWRDNVGRRLLVADHVPPGGCWKLDSTGHDLWEVAIDRARNKRRGPGAEGFTIECLSDRLPCLNGERY